MWSTQGGFHAGIGWNNDFGLIAGYSPDKGLGGGYMSNGNINMYHFSFNYNAPEQAAKKAVNETRTNFFYLTGVALGSIDLLSTGGNHIINGSISFFESMNAYSASVGLNYAQEISYLQNVGKGVKALGPATIAVGSLLDFGIGLPNYYTHGETHPLAVSPSKASLNLGIGVYSLHNPSIGALYFGLETFYPGGTHGALNMTEYLIIQNQKTIPNFNLYGGYTKY